MMCVVLRLGGWVVPVFLGLRLLVLRFKILVLVGSMLCLD